MRDTSSQHTDAPSIYSGEYKHWYRSRAWKHIRIVELNRAPLCEWCKERGVLKHATEVHHLIPHKGDYELFLAGPFACLCKDCHDSTARAIERQGFHKAIDVDGYPIDPKHPANRMN